VSFDFPNTPAEDQEFTPAGGATYVYKLPHWQVKSVGYLPLTGGTLTGNLTISSAGVLVVQSTAASVSPTTGALTVGGGVGVDGNIYSSATVTAQVFQGASGPGALVLLPNPGLPNVHVAADTTSGENIYLQGWNAAGTAPPNNVWIAGRFQAEIPTLNLVATITKITAVTPSSNPTTGALTVGGGIGVGGDLCTPGFTLQGTVTPNLVWHPTSGATSVFQIYQNANTAVLSSSTFGPAVVIDLPTCQVNVPQGTASSNPTTGALTVAGGLGVSGGVNGAGIITSNTQLTVNDGTHVTNLHPNYGGIGPAVQVVTNHPLLFATNNLERMRIAASGDVNITNTTPSSNPSTGALTVAGGLGVSGDIRAQGGVYSAGTLLTCYGIEYLKYGKVDLAYWDSVSSTGKHEPARKFAEMVKEFDPRDPRQYIKRMLQDEALPGMPTKAEWEQNQLSLDEMNNKLWLAVELLASAFAGALDRIEALEAKQREVY
jgi:hypothetical protein